MKIYDMFKTIKSVIPIEKDTVLKVGDIVEAGDEYSMIGIITKILQQTDKPEWDDLFEIKNRDGDVFEFPKGEIHSIVKDKSLRLEFEKYL